METCGLLATHTSRVDRQYWTLRATDERKAEISRTHWHANGCNARKAAARCNIYALIKAKDILSVASETL